MNENTKNTEVLNPEDEMLLTGFNFDHSILMKPNYNFDNEGKNNKKVQ